VSNGYNPAKTRRILAPPMGVAILAKVTG